MLVQIRVKNFLSFKDEQVLSFEPDSLKDIDLPLIKYTKFDLSYTLLKSLVLFGHNSYGKSNVIKSLQFFINQIFHSYSNAKNSDSIEVNNFKLNDYSEKDETKIELTFILNEMKFRFGFVINQGIIIEEYLFHGKYKMRENSIYTRKDNEIRYNSSLKKDGLDINIVNSLTKSNSLVFSTLLELGDTPIIIKEIANWFKSWIIISDLRDFNYVEKAKKIYSNPLYSATIFKFLENSDIGFTTVKKKLDDKYKNSEDYDFMVNVVNSDEVENFNLLTEHERFSSEKVKILPNLFFELLKNESSGSIKYFFLACFLSKSIIKGTPIFIDELDSKFHSHLIENLIDVFLNESNIGAQLLFTSHNPYILDNKDLFRRDQIILVDKNTYGESSLKSMHTKGDPLRNDQSRIKLYLEGKKGGISKKRILKNEDPNQIKLDI